MRTRMRVRAASAAERWLLRMALKAYSPVRAGEKAEGKQQRKRAEARHDEIDITSAEILPHLVVRHHQRP